MRKDKDKKAPTILKSKELLEKEYSKRNAKLEDEMKIFSVSHLVKILEKEKEQYRKEIEAEEQLTYANKYNEKQKQYTSEITMYKEIIEASKNIEIIIEKIQMEFLKCFKIQIEQANTKEKLINLLYKMNIIGVKNILEALRVLEIKKS